MVTSRPSLRFLVDRFLAKTSNAYEASPGHQPKIHLHYGDCDQFKRKDAFLTLTIQNDSNSYSEEEISVFNQVLACQTATIPGLDKKRGEGLKAAGKFFHEIGAKAQVSYSDNTFTTTISNIIIHD